FSWRNFSWNFHAGEWTTIRSCATAAIDRARVGSVLPLHAGAADRSALPSSAGLLRIRRRGNWPLRTVGRRLDGAGADSALSSMRHPRAGFRTGRAACARALVAAVALRPLAGHERNADAVVASVELLVISLCA